MFSPNVAGSVAPDTRLARRTFVRETPRPSVSKPEAGEHHDGGGFARPIFDSNSQVNIVGFCFAYSAVTSKYRFSANTPVSISSYSGSLRPRRPFSSTS